MGRIIKYFGDQPCPPLQSTMPTSVDPGYSCIPASCPSFGESRSRDGPPVMRAILSEVEPREPNRRGHVGVKNDGTVLACNSKELEASRRHGVNNAAGWKAEAGDPDGAVFSMSSEPCRRSGHPSMRAGRFSSSVLQIYQRIIDWNRKGQVTP